MRTCRRARRSSRASPPRLEPCTTKPRLGHCSRCRVACISGVRHAASFERPALHQAQHPGHRLAAHPRPRRSHRPAADAGAAGAHPARERARLRAALRRRLRLHVHLRGRHRAQRLDDAFQLEGPQRESMALGIDAVRLLGNRMTGIQAGMNGLIEVLAGLAIALVVLYAGWRNLYASDTPGHFFAFIAALLMASDPLRRLSRMQLQLTASAVIAKMMYDLLDTPVSERDEPGAVDLKVTGAEVRFNKVGFAYKPETPVLSDLSFFAPAGRTTALVGASGAGKTTIFNLLLGFWVPERGTIAIDSQPISGLALASLRRQIALVSQDVFLFDGTIRANIKAGRQGATDDEVVAAARAAHADDFIRSLPGGYDTPVGELGTQVSGGQRQRIALARAFLKDAPIILLDEPTSALDSETELVIQRALRELATNRTTLVIAHRLATVLRADLIHVVDGGRVVELGTHDELLSANGAYARLYELQFMGEAEQQLGV